MIKSSSTGALVPEMIKKSERQELDVDFYIKFYFTTLSKDYIDLDADSDCVISEGLSYRNIIDSGKFFFEEGKKGHVFFVDCSDCVIDEKSIMVETGCALSKVLLAVDCLKTFAEKYISIVRSGRMHVAIYAIDLIEDIAQSFAYIVDEDCGLQIVDEKLCSYVLRLNSAFDELKDRGWLLYVDYFAILDYYVLARPIQIGIAIEEHVNSNLEHNENSNIAKLAQCNNDADIVQNIEKDKSDEIPPYLYEGKVSYNDFVFQPAEKDCLDKLQNFLDWVSILPGGELFSSINGFIYLTKEIKACVDWDEDEINENKKKAIDSFVGAIPGTSLMRAAIKIKQVSKIYKKIEKGQNLLVEIKKKSRKSEQALNRIKQKRTSKKNMTVVKQKHVFNNRIYKKASMNTEKIIERDTKKIGDLGLTIEDLTSEGKTMLTNYRKIIGKLGKLPKTSYDEAIEIFERLFSVEQKYTESVRSEDPESAVW